jgi:hypothetical protein
MNLELFDNPITQAVGEAGRISHDFYPTPEGITRSLLEVCPQLPRFIFEPCAGNGAIGDVLRASRRYVEESDIQWPTIKNLDLPMGFIPQDATSVSFWEYWASLDFRSYYPDGIVPEWATVTNPPFNLAHEILPLAYEYSPWGCAFLLRLSYLEPAANRAKWLQENADNLRYVMPVNPRPQFRRDSKSTDSSTVAWMVWQKSWSWKELGVNSPFQFCNNWKK